MPFEGGPYVKAALFVNQVIEGKDNVLSLIRVIDRLTTTASGPEAPQQMPVTTFGMRLVIMLVPGRARGRHQVRIVREAPDGARNEVWSIGIQLEGETKGRNLNLALTETFTLEGTYWYDVYVDDQLMTRMPFEVLYQPVISGVRG